jgi:hypothetical protein
MADLPTDAQICTKMEALMKTVDLNTMSTKQFIAALSDKFGGVDLSSKKKFIEATIMDILDANATYESAAAAEEKGSYKESLRLYHSLLAEAAPSDKPMIKEAIKRVIDKIYGLKGSDESVCIWKPFPLLSKSMPPPLQFRATCQLGDKIYVHGGIDFCENDM